MRVYCEEAARHGDIKTNVMEPSRTVTVILNPNANKGKAKKQFETYCAPILHLAGISVDLILTQSEGHAKTILDKVHQTEAIVIGGGDGTVSEVITGLLRRCDNDASKNHCPIGVLPLGQSNTLAKSLFPDEDKLADVRSLAEATMAVVKQHTKRIDLMKIEVEGEANEVKPKPIYAVDEIEWGVFRNAKSLKDKYWYFGGLRNYATYIFNGAEFQSPCEAMLSYSLPCSGCANCCRSTPDKPSKWYNGFWGQKKSTVKVYTEENPECKEIFEKSVATTSVSLKTTNTVDGLDSDIPKLLISVGPYKIDYFEFVKQGWKHEKQIVENVPARMVKLLPSKEEDSQELSIDNETFDLKPITVTLLPKALPVFIKS